MKKSVISPMSVFGILGLSALPALATPPSSPSTSRSKPNIVIILCDDMGYGDLNSYGATQYTTPNLDRLASKGVRFTNFYVSQAVCSASRAALLTGCYSNRVGIAGALMPISPVGLNPEEETIAEVLHKQGYTSGIFGKWHLGDHPKFRPLQQGFDEYLGLPYSNDMWKYDLDGTVVRPEKNRYKASYPPLPLIDGDRQLKEIRTMEDQSELTTRYTERAVAFIHKHRKDPFFLYMPHSMPHVPIAASSKFRGKSEQGTYGDVIMEIDWSVGQVLDALQNEGLTSNTLVVFTSDNGPWLCYGNHAGSAGGLREGKGTSFEGGQRVPCLMRWPGHIPEGSVSNRIAATIDLLPTIAEISGAPLPQKKIDGVSILSLMTGVPGANPRQIFYYYYFGNCLEGVRKNQWKLVLPHTSKTYEGYLPGQDGKAGEIGEIQVKEGLYDLRRDPGERYDVKDKYPNVLAELHQIADSARAELGDDLLKIKGAGVREPGRVVIPFNQFEPDNR